LRTWIHTLFKSLWGIYLVLTSIYCLLAFLPYTYIALIKAPPYDWMPWFAHHQALLYFIALGGVAAAEWPWKKSVGFLVLFGGLGLAGVGLFVHPFLPGLKNDSAAYVWSLVALVPIVVVAIRDLIENWQAHREEAGQAQFGYSSAGLIAIAIGLVYVVGGAMHSYADSRSLGSGFSIAGFEIAAWGLLSQVVVAIAAISALNLIWMASSKTRHATSFRLVAIGLFTFGGLWWALFGFLNDAMSFDGAPAHVYAAGLALSLTLLLASVILPLRQRRPKVNRGVLWFALVLLSVAAIALPTLIGGGDWNGVLQHSFTLLFWIGFSVCVYRLWPKRSTYSLPTIIGVLLISGFAYKGLQATEIFWAKPVGSTDDEIARALDIYGERNVSFQMAHHLLGNTRHEACGNLCRILREYTNVRDAEAKVDINLVDPLVRSTGSHPNIFIFVIDSVRTDYLGAYNPQVDFTPNLDAFARDSIAVHNVYTQYAGTTLSEPAIWAGSMLLHAHYMQPFSKVNGLEKLANTDGYQMVVSYDTVLSQILSPTDNIIKLDTDKPLWNRFEVCSTIQQTESALDGHKDKSKPVLFYAQPMNVHQFAVNNMPRMTSATWRMRDGFNNRIAYELHEVDECMGSFFSYLKDRHLYDDSIIIVTSDHGDATGELGRYSHSMSIYPEVMRVPLIVHLPAGLRKSVICDDTHLSALADITPSLYYLLGHRPVRSGPFFGRPLFVATKEELNRRDQLFLASDERAVYGVLTENGRFLYATYDSPAQSFLFDLSKDPLALHNVLTDPVKQRFDEQVIENLQALGDFYGYKPGVGSLLVAAH